MSDPPSSPDGARYSIREPGRGLQIGDANTQINYFRGPGFMSSLLGLLRSTRVPLSTGAQKLQFLFRFLNHSLLQSTITFALSMVITTAGALILLVGAALALKHAGEPGVNYTGIITSLSGVIITACGGAFTVQANKARAHATEQAKQVQLDLKEDLAYDRQQKKQEHEQARQDQAHDRATAKITNIKDDELRDRLLAISALNDLGLSPNPVDLSKDLPTKKVESERLPDSGEITP